MARPSARVTMVVASAIAAGVAAGTLDSVARLLSPAVHAQAAGLTTVGSIPGPAELVRAAGTQAYVVSGRTLTIYDIANPAAPARRGSYEFPEKVWGFRVYGSLLYVANGFNGLQIIDASNPDKPVLHGAIKTQGQSKNVSVTGGRAVVANHMTGVDVIDVSDTTKPAYLGSAFVDGYARDAATAGRMAYAVDNPSGLYVLDMSAATSRNIEPSNALQEAHTPQHIEVSDGGRLAVLAGGEPYDPKRAPRPAGTLPRGTLQIWDLATPAAPKLAALYRTPGLARHVALRGSMAYVADSVDGVHVVDLSTPAKPVAVGSVKTDAPARHIAITGSTLLVVIGGPPTAPGQPASSVAVLSLAR